MPLPKDNDTSLSNITNSSTAVVRTPHTFDAISTQILSLTSIATNLQREMAQLSRRSKDNATDLVSLKEATIARDEDIRKSLRDLVSNLSLHLPESEVDAHSQSVGRDNRRIGGFLLDSKPHVSPPGLPKSFSLPRIPSPNSFATSLDRDFPGVPYSMDGTASIALLEKVLREMGTKEGQERLVSSLSELKDRPITKHSDPIVTKKLEEILCFLKDGSESRALVARKDNGNGIGDKPPKLDLDFPSPRSMPLSRTNKDITSNASPQNNANSDSQQSLSNPRAANFVTDDMLKLLKRMKDSITEGGGLTAEIKALVRELRGEVLGMGREIGRKLEQAESTHGQSNGRRDAHGPGREEIAKIVEDGLAELKEHMDQVMRDRRRQSSSSAISRSTVDGQEVYNAVKNALSELPLQQQVAVQHPGSGIEREDILEAVREAWETYKPEIELQNFGLERDEILQCLKEGLEAYERKNESQTLERISYEEVLDAVREGLEHFKPPAPIETEATITKDEILETVRECLESFEFPASNVGTTRELEMTREDVLEAVKEGLSAQAAPSREIEFNRDDLFDAVKAGLEGAPTPMGGVGEQVLDKMQDLIDGMKLEFKQYSAANGGDTEQVLDAMKDGLEVLRADIETYVDRAADVTGKDEIIETIRNGLDHLRLDLEGSIANAPRNITQTDNGELLDAMEKEFEHLRQTIATSIVRSEAPSSDKEDILDAIRDGLEEMKGKVSRNSDSEGSEAALLMMKEELEHLRESLATTLIRGGASTDKEEILETLREGLEGLRADVSRGHDRPESVISSTGELLDALNDGLDGLRSDVEKMVNKPLDMTVNYEILDTLKEGLVAVRSDIDRLRNAQNEQVEVGSRRGGEVVIAEGEGLQRNDIERLEIMITQLRIKVESLDSVPATAPAPQPMRQPAEGSITGEDLEGIAAMLRGVQESVAGFAGREHTQSENAATKDDTEAIETLLRNTKARLDEMIFPDLDSMARTEHLESVESTVKATRDAVDDFAMRLESDAASKEDIGVLEALLKDVKSGLEEMREKVEIDDAESRVSKADIETLGTLCMDTKTQIEELILPDVDTLPTKIEFEGLGGLIEDFRQKMETEADLTAQAFESRKIEHGGLADKIEEVKGFLDEIRKELKTKLKEGEHSIEGLAQTLETINDTILAGDTTSAVKELVDTVNREFERTHGISEEAQLESEQKHAILFQKHDEQKAAIVAELVSKIDSRFDEIMTKYDDAQLAAEEKERAMGYKDTQQTEALNGTRAVAEELRIIIDTLGSTITDSCDRMGEDSKTVFNRIEDLGAKMNGITASLPADWKNEHQLTRGEISKALTGVEGVQAHISEYHPKILDAVNDILGIVGQHYEQAKASTEEIKMSVNAIPTAMPLPAIAEPITLPPLIRDGPSPEKYDDTEVHAKLDKLVEHSAEVGVSAAQFEMLEQIREQVAATANELNLFVASQQARITESHETRSRETEEVAIALEKRTAQKENVESEIMRLSEHKIDLNKEVQELLKDKEELAAQKSKMQADLSSLETALQIRREELHVMEARAEGLERRILDGVLDHSRSLLMTSRPQSSLREMNLKRVVSSASNTTTATRTSTAELTAPVPTSAVSSGVGMALKRRPPPRRLGTSSGSNQSDRRILSLSTIGGNKGAGVERSMVLADPSFVGGAGKGSGFGMSALKRSHSVKSNFPVRKASWGGTKALGMYADEGAEEDEDKENSVLDEEDEEGEGSETGTERRTSYTGTERRTSYSGTLTGTLGSYEGRSSVGGDSERRTSYATSTVGTVGRRDDSIIENGDEGDEGHSEDASTAGVEGETGSALAAKGQISNACEMVVFGVPSDSGIGTDMPTAALEAEGGSDYFKR